MSGEQDIKKVTVEPVTGAQMREFFRQQEARDGLPPRIHAGNFQNFVDCPNGFGRHFAMPLHDKGIPEPLRQYASVYREIGVKYCGLEDDSSASIAIRQFAGFTLKQSARFAGPCVEDFTYLQGWEFEDAPTVDVIIFVPMGLVERSKGLNPQQQLEVLGEIREKYKLPPHHLVDFGEVGSNADIILAHRERTAEWVPKNGLSVRNDTLTVGRVRGRLRLIWREGRLYCGLWNGDDVVDNLGCFARGVEILKPLAA